MGDRFQRVGPGTVMFVPANVDHYGLASVDDEDLVLLEFQPIVRQDMRRALTTSDGGYRATPPPRFPSRAVK